MTFTPLLDCSVAVQAHVRDLRNQPQVRQFMYTEHEISEAEHQAWLNSLRGNERQSVFVVMVDEQPAGVVSLNAINRVHHTADWAFYLDSALQGKGYGSQVECWLLDHAFGEAGLAKLNCEVLASNPAVIRLHQKFGFNLEGVRRQNVLKHGERIDVMLLGITAPEWQAKRPQLLDTLRRLAR
ncbi:MAG: UDP-4-amino-4,6-dideoxy-N-acetyl-beta-L-altrosamine N-acetyltransferase [Pseudomonas sp.]|uniref:UDP-4-amino-4, 6-dideoxy-N-acetyl-beta-L-altrosamine N-acetyltransferase n=1 Tax=Pseudomonas abieticivorans TaxID=2931382 RepID=UPI0020BFAF2C|nr:UDP-4-amino-4,6-dideoxy-N-acetyl-beta-L-altrosamine N-acetyltransferase [Pseudomonas sp. PIA16]MDE1167350.1 UDP-4-amino-4,6-dideoxy-N-acetyl-beta-L-altrosamine N-acetyltransferase [Pseudomonas sp.]